MLAMDDIITEILALLRAGENPSAKDIAAILRRHNRGRGGAAGTERAPFAKKQLLPHYFALKQANAHTWQSWQVDSTLERKLIACLQVKPRRTASGVATITVLTKPHPCASACLYCPNDLRMPKSYLADEPACQRAERCCFDPYLQVVARLRTLQRMGHTTDKIELIVLGGTWSDYPESYRIWFVAELFRALNDCDTEGTLADEQAEARRVQYHHAGIATERDELAEHVAKYQQAITQGTLSYNEGVRQLYTLNEGWQRISCSQTATLEELDALHVANENAAHRVVGLVIETRPDDISPKGLSLIRQLGCTKVQIGIQSLDERILRANNRAISPAQIEYALSLLRLFGFKTHVHFMANLYGATLKLDKADYAKLVSDPAFLPDEVKIYPCALVTGTGLCAHYEDGSWQPYSEEELVSLLVHDMAITPAYTRVSRMIRDISSHDIVAGNKKINLRQLVERRAAEEGVHLCEIRSREINANAPTRSELRLEDIEYHTSCTCEHFLQWVADDGRIAGFLRLSLPNQAQLAQFPGIPIGAGEAMIREVHVYGRVAGLHAQAEGGAQHTGLGRALIEEACRIAECAGYSAMNVISAVGTRGYYRALGFTDTGLYQQKPLSSSKG